MSGCLDSRPPDTGGNRIVRSPEVDLDVDVDLDVNMNVNVDARSNHLGQNSNDALQEVHPAFVVLD